MDVFDREKRSSIMKRIRSTHTKPEEILCKALFHMGCRYRKNVKALPGKPDIVFSRQRIAVFVHGCFWHSHPGCRYASVPKTNEQYWLPKLARNCERDKINCEKLQALGWQVVVVWECEIKKNLQQIAADIYRMIKGELPPSEF